MFLFNLNLMSTPIILSPSKGTAARDFSGNLIWSRSELAAPISDVANLMDTDQKFETSELVSGIGGGI